MIHYWLGFSFFFHTVPFLGNFLPESLNCKRVYFHLFTSLCLGDDNSYIVLAMNHKNMIDETLIFFSPKISISKYNKNTRERRSLPMEEEFISEGRGVYFSG